MTSPREQLIEAIGKTIENTLIRHTGEAIGELARKPVAESALKALSDLGAVVLMPAKIGELENGTSIWRRNAVEISGGQVFEKDGPDYRVHHPENAVYVNALEGERS
jgi:hypothetical protein